MLTRRGFTSVCNVRYIGVFGQTSYLGGDLIVGIFQRQGLGGGAISVLLVIGDFGGIWGFFLYYFNEGYMLLELGTCGFADLFLIICVCS